MNKELLELIKEYNLSHGINAQKKRDYLKSLTEDELFKSIWNFGSVKIDGKSRWSSHFKNNRWFNMYQTTNTGQTVQFRDALIEKLKNRGVLRNHQLRNFEDIYNIVEEIIAELNSIGLKGAAQMTKYDIASYIGDNKGVSTEKVYLHRGVRDGALALGIISTKKNHILTLKEIYEKRPELKKLKSADDIENFLCISKKQIAALKL